MSIFIKAKCDRCGHEVGMIMQGVNVLPPPLTDGKGVLSVKEAEPDTTITPLEHEVVSEGGDTPKPNKPKTFGFHGAMILLEEGHIVRRLAWPIDDPYIRHGTHYSWTVTREDIMATDWVRVYVAESEE